MDFFASLPLAENYILDNDDWKYDVMPEFMDGKNVADFFSADIAEQLTKLEAEEERLDGEGFYESGDEEEVSLARKSSNAVILIRMGKAQFGGRGDRRRGRADRKAESPAQAQIASQTHQPRRHPTQGQERHPQGIHHGHAPDRPGSQAP